RDLGAKRLQLLREAAPWVSRVAVLLDPTNPGQVAMYTRSETETKVAGMTLKRIDVRSQTDLDVGFATALQHRVEALEIFPLPLAEPSLVAHGGPRACFIHERTRT
ncbi:MAG: hypothetical protein ACREKS_06690, partial [Candidatus Rokuibacteriota bacterium]